MPILQNAWEFEKLLDLYRLRLPRSVLEVGSMHGGTLYWWLQLAERDARVVSLDLGSPVDNSALFPTWVPEGVELVVIQGNSHDPEIVAEVGSHGPYDWIFIDAGHLYEDVKADWENYMPMASEGAVIALHDADAASSRQAAIEVNDFWIELQRQGYVTQQIFAGRAHGAWGIGVVYL